MEKQRKGHAGRWTTVSATSAWYFSEGDRCDERVILDEEDRGNEDFQALKQEIEEKQFDVDDFSIS